MLTLLQENKTYPVKCWICGFEMSVHEETLSVTGLQCPGCAAVMDEQFRLYLHNIHRRRALHSEGSPC